MSKYVGYPWRLCGVERHDRVGKGGCWFCGGSGIAPHPECPAGNGIEDDDAQLRNTVAIEDNLKTEAPIERKGPKT